MPRKDDQLHRLAHVIMEECGEHAHLLASVRAVNLRSEGDWGKAKLWERVAALVAEIQGRPPKHRHH